MKRSLVQLRDRAWKAVCLFWANPCLFLERCTAEIASRRPLPDRPIKLRIRGVEFELDTRIDWSVKAMFRRSYEVETVAALRRFLRKGDIFLDVGANIGYLSGIALGLVGRTGQVHAFEPVPEHCARLLDLARSNRGFTLVVNQSAVGEKQGHTAINVTNQPNMGWNTMVPGLMPPHMIKRSVLVPVCRLDQYIAETRIDDISLIKIDTEGYELPVLKGLQGYLASATRQPVVICEIAPIAYPLMGSSLRSLANCLEDYGYRAVSLTDFRTEIEIQTLRDVTTVLLRPKS